MQNPLPFAASGFPKARIRNIDIQIFHASDRTHILQGGGFSNRSRSSVIRFAGIHTMLAIPKGHMEHEKPVVAPTSSCERTLRAIIPSTRGCGRGTLHFISNPTTDKSTHPPFNGTLCHCIGAATTLHWRSSAPKCPNCGVQVQQNFTNPICLKLFPPFWGVSKRPKKT